MILSRMPDYVHYICPQFSRTDVNFQRVPTIDTANPFTLDEIPSNDESMVVIHISNRRKISPDYRYLLEMLQGSFMSRPDTIVVPAGKMVFAMELLLNPVIERMMERRDLAIKKSAAGDAARVECNMEILRLAGLASRSRKAAVILVRACVQEGEVDALHSGS